MSVQQDTQNTSNIMRKNKDYKLFISYFKTLLPGKRVPLSLFKARQGKFIYIRRLRINAAETYYIMAFYNRHLKSKDNKLNTTVIQ